MPSQKFRSPVIGSFEDIGKDVVGETAKLPKDIAGNILETVTGPAGSKGKKQSPPIVSEEHKESPDGALGTLDKTKDQKVKKAIARAALAELAQGTKKPEPTVFEKKQREEQEKKEVEKKQKQQVATIALPEMSSKKRRGDLYGVQGKTSSEKSRNVRQD